MVRALVHGGGFPPGLTLEDVELGAIRTADPHGRRTDDSVGTMDMWRRVVGLLPRGEMLLVEGNMPCLDNPGQVGSGICSFLTA
jgi:hypothetical protein